MLSTKKKERFEIILEPLQAILQLSLLSFCPIGTKLTIQNNLLYVQPPSWHQGIMRRYNNDTQADVFFLFNVIRRFNKFYAYLKSSKVTEEIKLHKLLKEHADRNNALAYYMNENEAFPEYTSLNKTLEFYFQICSILSNTRTLSVVAGTLANVGVCPLTNETVFESTICQNCLSLMYMCGMYDYSGRFAFEVGLPAKSGVSGCLLLVIPKVMGICIFSPRLDKNGNSVKGVEFSKKLVEKFPFHIFNEIVSKKDVVISPKSSNDDPELLTHLFINAASKGNLAQLKEILDKVDINACDYDNRTALHLAAAEGHIDVVIFLLEKGIDKDVKDRWGSTALSEASNKEGSIYEEICQLLINLEDSSSEKSPSPSET